jgi:hypothetical protein
VVSDWQSALRSKTPELVRQEVWGLLLAHFAVRGLMHEAALRADEDPDRLSFSHAVRVVRRGQRPGPDGAARGQTHDERLAAAASYTPTHHPDRLRRRHPDRKVNSIGV